MKIDVHVLCKNEIKLAPFFIDYWRVLGDDVNVYVYDGSSSDGTRELFSNYEWIHIVNFEPDALDDNQHAILKNNCWKGSDADFVMVCDFDETIFSYDVTTLHEELQYMKDNAYTILAPLSFNLIPDEFPKYEKGFFLHELAQYGFNDYVWEAKPILFNPKQIKEIQYVWGGHSARPVGNVKWYLSDKLFLIHAKFLGFDFYVERIRNRVVSDWNNSHGIDGETKKSIERLEREFLTRKNKRFKWNDIKENFNNYYKKRVDWSLWGGMRV